MGTLRTLFALAVVLAHVHDGEAFVGAKNAVQLFYLISGFLMSYVITETRTYATKGDFYISRWLRLYPIYFVVGILTLVALTFARQSAFFEVYRDAPASAVVALVAANLLLFSQDWIHFIAVEGGRLVFSQNFNESEVLLYRGLLVPQAWTLGVELSFYLIAPIVLPRRKLLLTILMLSLGLRLYLFLVGLGTTDPWSYRFFPAELTFFLIGALAHQVLLPSYRRYLSTGLSGAAAICTGVMIIFVIAYPWIPLAILAKELILFGLFTVLVPMTFVFQGESSIDRWIGELSYPIYINHILVIMLVAFFDRKFGIGAVAVAVAVIVISVGFAILLNRYVGVPVERIRTSLKKKRIC